MNQSQWHMKEFSTRLIEITPFELDASNLLKTVFFSLFFHLECWVQDSSLNESIGLCAMPCLCDLYCFTSDSNISLKQCEVHIFHSIIIRRVYRLHYCVAWHHPIYITCAMAHSFVRSRYKLPLISDLYCCWICKRTRRRRSVFNFEANWKQFNTKSVKSQWLFTFWSSNTANIRVSIYKYDVEWAVTVVFHEKGIVLKSSKKVCLYIGTHTQYIKNTLAI